MSRYECTIRWSRNGEPFTDNRYSRAHEWEFDGGVTVPASSSPQVVPLPMSSENAVDPEEAFVASISSCHMLWFLSLAAKQRLVVDSYVDSPVGLMEKDGSGRYAITRVELRPDVTFAGTQPGAEQLEDLHHRAHQECFIARSVRSEITVTAPVRK